MSKSLGNAIGIHEPPLEMYGKIMSISDEMMWRYYELLTDVQIADIEKMKSEMHPMQAKKELARRIVADFHSAEAAGKAGEDWARQFQKSEVPEEIESVEVSLHDVQVDAQGKQPVFVIRGSGPAGRSIIRLDKLIRHAGLAASNSEAGKLVKGGAVAIETETVGESSFIADVPLDHYFFLRVGRRMKRVRVVNGISPK